MEFNTSITFRLHPCSHPAGAKVWRQQPQGCGRGPFSLLSLSQHCQVPPQHHSTFYVVFALDRMLHVSNTPYVTHCLRTHFSVTPCLSHLPRGEILARGRQTERGGTDSLRREARTLQKKEWREFDQGTNDRSEWPSTRLALYPNAPSKFLTRA